MAKVTLTFTTTQNWTVPNNCYKIAELFLVGGGGGGAGGATDGNGGGGGAGGQVVLARDIKVTPGQSISLTIGGGGAGGGVGANGSTGGTTSFGSSYSAGGGGGGATNGGAGGSTSVNFFGSVTNYAGHPNGGAAGAGAGATSKNGGRGYSYNNVLYAGGGGGGIDSFNEATARPITPGQGGPDGGGNGGGENTAGVAGDDNPAGTGANGKGGGGGGGAASGTATEKTTPAVQNPNPAAASRTSAATSGARGGSGAIIISYDPAEFSMVPRTTGIREGETITIDVKTAHVMDATTIPYTISGDVTQEDFSPVGLTGSFTVSSSNTGNTGTGTILITAANDAFTEASSELATVSLNNGLALTSFLVGDFSQNPLVNIESKLIATADYNDIRNKVARVLGFSTTTNADYGWGQLVQSSAVSESTKVGATDWNNLRFDIINAWVHLYNTTPTLTTAVQHNKIRGNYLTSPYSQYDSCANVIESNRFNVSSSQVVVTTESPIETTWPGPYGTSWNTQAYCIVTFTWSTSAEARHFFNSGGEIRFRCSRTGGTSSNQNSAWTQILAAAGQQAFGGSKPLIGKNGSDGKNFYRLTNNYQTWYEISSSSPYASNVFKITARSPGVTNNNNGTATSVQFRIDWIDGHTPQGGSPADSVDGTLTVNIEVQRAIGSLQPSGSGTFTIAAPAITINNPPRT